MTKTVALIDGDILAYRCGFAAEHKKYKATIDGKEMVFDGKTALNTYLKEHPEVEEVEWESELTVEPIDHVLSTVKHMIANIKNELRADEVLLYLSARRTFRDDVATVLKYKGNRDKLRRPIHHDAILTYINKYHGAITMPNLEADDMLATELLVRTEAGQNAILCSIDKDLLQVPGKHYNFVTGKKVIITPETGLRKLYEQMLMGDATDNIPGIYGLGPVTATKILSEYHSTPSILWEAVKQQWDKHLAWADKPPTWLTEYTKVQGRDVLHYPHWGTGERVTKSLDGFLKELYTLLKVGVPT